MIRGKANHDGVHLPQNMPKSGICEISETSGASEASTGLLFSRNPIVWKPEIRRREHRCHVFSGKYRNVGFSRSWEKPLKSGEPTKQLKQVLRRSDDLHRKWHLGEAGRCEQADKVSSPTWDQNMNSARSWEKSSQWSQEGHLSKPEHFQDDLKTLP